jgi:hypothetical protein
MHYKHRTNPRTRLRVAGVISLLLIPLLQTAHALIFPLATETYDDKKNLIPYSYAHARGHEIGHFFNESQGMTFLGTAIAPNWFITANHTATPGGVHVFYDSLGKPHEVLSIIPSLNHPLSPDLALVKVRDTLPFYSRISKAAVLTNQQAKVYGLSSSSWAHGALRGSTGNIQARFNVPGTGLEGLRWGLARYDRVWPGGFIWPFTARDPEFGSDCAGVALGDSGGAVFLRQNLRDTPYLAGIITQLMGVPYKITNVRSNDSHAVLSARVWNESGFYNCGSAQPLDPGNKASAYGQDVGFYSSTIYQIISPPVRLCVAKTQTNWTQFDFGNNPNQRTIYSTDSKIDLEGLDRPAPEFIYQTLHLSSSDLKESLIFNAPNLLRNEKYRIRIHLSSISIPGLVYSNVSDFVTIKDSSGSHKYGPVMPYQKGLNGGTIWELPATFTPNSANAISAVVTPDRIPGHFAVVSGVEILLVQ